MSTNTLRQWIKSRETPLADFLYRCFMALRHASVPVVPIIHRPLYHAHIAVVRGLSEVVRVLWYTPLFQSRLEAPARGLRLYNGFPYVTGNVRIRIGENCRMGGRFDINGRTSATQEQPEFVVGDNVDLGWGGVVSVGRKVVLGNNVRLAAGVLISGYPGHPLDAAARARGEADTDDQVGDVIIEDDVWLASRVIVIGPARIGRGTIVAAGSVVTRDLPPFVLAAGVPAKPVRSLADGEKQ